MEQQPMRYPDMFRISQQFDSSKIDDVPGAVRSEIQRLRLSRSLLSGRTVAVAVGSRGIANLSQIVRVTIQELKVLGARPYIVPAMGSHGGGTAEGQKNILACYEITENKMGVPIRSSMAVTQIGKTDFGMPVYLDNNAAQADHVVLINRIKPHTRFTGEIESGLMKMMLIGLGKQKGASIYHSAFLTYSFNKVIHTACRIIRQGISLLFGLGINENAYGEVSQITAIRANELEKIEPLLLKKAKEDYPKLPFKNIDLLIIDKMGKDISGAGLDTNVIGRKWKESISPSEDKEAQKESNQDIRWIFVRDLTQKTSGNAIGIGMADFTTNRLVKKIDFQSTYLNAMTSGHISAVSVPMHFLKDKEAIDVALRFIDSVDEIEPRIVWIQNTLDLTEVEVSAAFQKSVYNRSDIEIISKLRPLRIDANGNLPAFKHFSELYNGSATFR